MQSTLTEVHPSAGTDSADSQHQLWEHGYAVVRGVFSPADVAAIAAEMDRLKADGLRYRATYRDRNLAYIIRPHPTLGCHLRFMYWPEYISPVLARYRTDPRLLDLLEPLIGDNIKQIDNQATWKTPRGDDMAFGFRQDARFRHLVRGRASVVQTFIAVDPHRVENGCLKIVAGSHELGPLDPPANGRGRDQPWENADLERWGLDPDRVVDLALDPGDVALWLPQTLHASGPNRSSTDRRTYVNGLRGSRELRSRRVGLSRRPVVRARGTHADRVRRSLRAPGASLHRGCQPSAQTTLRLVSRGRRWYARLTTRKWRNWQTRRT